MAKNLPAYTGDAGNLCSIPLSGRSPGEGNGNLLWYSCLENPTDKGVWQATVHSVGKLTQLSTKTNSDSLSSQSPLAKN